MIFAFFSLGKNLKTAPLEISTCDLEGVSMYWNIFSSIQCGEWVINEHFFLWLIPPVSDPLRERDYWLYSELKMSHSIFKKWRWIRTFIIITFATKQNYWIWGFLQGISISYQMLWNFALENVSLIGGLSTLLVVVITFLYIYGIPKVIC